MNKKKEAAQLEANKKIEYGANRCPACQVLIGDDTDFCPLCGSVLEMDYVGKKTYPNILAQRKVIGLLYRVMVFLSLLFTVCCVWFEYGRTHRIHWSIVIGGGLCFSLYVLHVALIDNKGYKRRIFDIAIATLLFMILVDYEVGFYRWSINYVLPATILVLELIFVIIMLANFRNWQSYLFLEFGMIFFGLIPLALGLMGITDHPFFGYLALGITIIVFLGVVIIGGRKAIAELKRRFRV